MLELFVNHDVGATWATVGLLFAHSGTDLAEFVPDVLPRYSDTGLSPYAEQVGASEEDDPLHFAGSLINRIAATPRQEIGSHTFSHYYCLEPGQEKDAFRADIEAAVAIARRDGYRLRSIAFPRNQFNPDYSDVLLDHGIVCYRGNQSTFFYRPRTAGRTSRLDRAFRLADAYFDIGGDHLTSWHETVEPTGLCNVPASFFLRPYSPRFARLEDLRIGRMVRAIEHAARTHQIAHVWWHPHNFGVCTEENLRLLESLLKSVSRLRSEYGLHVLSMAETAEIALCL